MPCPGRAEVARGGMGDPPAWSPQAAMLGLCLCSLLEGWEQDVGISFRLLCRGTLLLYPCLRIAVP